MPELIFETVVTTADAAGRVHVAPMGVRYPDDDRVVLMPFRPSATLDNVLATGSAVVNWLTDVRVFAGCVTGRRDWPVVDAVPAAGVASGVRAVRLAAALGHAPLALESVRDDAQRPALTLRRGPAVAHAPFVGFNRAQAAVLEAAVLVSRLGMLPAAKVDDELRYLRIAIDKTAGPAELEAWGWLVDAVDTHRARAAGVGTGAGGVDPAHAAR